MIQKGSLQTDIVSAPDDTSANRSDQSLLGRTYYEKVIRQYVTDIVLLMTLLLAGIIFTYNLPGLIDISLFDETRYLARGLMLEKSFPTAEYGPAYSVWYFFLSKFHSDPIDLYYLNYRVITILPALIFFLLMRTYKVPGILSFVLSLSFLCTAGNFLTWPKVSHFAILMLMFGLIILKYFNGKKEMILMLSLTSLFVSYVRPEFYYSCLFLTFVLLIVSIHQFFKSRSYYVFIPLAINLVALVILGLGVGIPTASGNRELIAFGQHYALNWNQWNNDAGNPWANWITIIHNDFGNINTAADALVSNPPAMVRHMFQNVQNAPEILYSMFNHFYPPSYPQRVAFRYGLLIFLIASIFYYNKHNLSKFLKRIVSNFTKSRFLLLLILITMLPVMMSMIVIFPRQHYMFMLFVIMVFVLTILLFGNEGNDEETNNFNYAAICCFVVLMLIRPLSESKGIVNQKNLKTTKFIRSLEIRTSINLLDAEGGYSIYLGNNFNQIEESSKEVPFKEFVRMNSINMILLTDELRNYMKYQSDPEWQSFLKNPGEMGFRQLTIPEFEKSKLLIRADVPLNEN
jgi:hypothetical protein